MSPLTFGSLFAGIGGFDLGFERAGMRGVWQVEIDDDARGVLARRFPNSEHHVDVREVGAHNLASVDVICGGFPCQDLSVAGKRGGLSGARSGLFFELIRITHELRPSFLVWENVPGLLSSEDGRDFATVLVSLDNIGYSGAWTILDSRYFGLAQRRRRVFGVFARDDIGAGPCAEILSLATRLRWHPETGEEKREDVARPIASGTKRGSGYRNDSDTAENLIVGTLSANRGGPDRPAGNANELDFCIPVARSQTARNTRLDGEADNFVFEPRFARNGRGAPDTIAPPLKAQNGGTGKGDGAPVVFQQNTRDEVRLVGGDGGISGALASQPGMKQQNYIGLMPRRGQHTGGDYAPTLNAGNGGMGAPGVAGRMGVRRLTPVECERLQGFPDGWTDGQSDSARYKQLGNAVSVPVAEWIGRRLAAVLERVR